MTIRFYRRSGRWEAVPCLSKGQLPHLKDWFHAWYDVKTVQDAIAQWLEEFGEYIVETEYHKAIETVFEKASYSAKIKNFRYTTIYKTP